MLRAIDGQYRSKAPDAVQSKMPIVREKLKSVLLMDLSFLPLAFDDLKPKLAQHAWFQALDFIENELGAGNSRPFISYLETQWGPKLPQIVRALIPEDFSFAGHTTTNVKESSWARSKRDFNGNSGMTKLVELCKGIIEDARRRCKQKADGMVTNSRAMQRVAMSLEVSEALDCRVYPEDGAVTVAALPANYHSNAGKMVHQRFQMGADMLRGLLATATETVERKESLDAQITRVLNTKVTMRGTSRTLRQHMSHAAASRGRQKRQRLASDEQWATAFAEAQEQHDRLKEEVAKLQPRMELYGCQNMVSSVKQALKQLSKTKTYGVDLRTGRCTCYFSKQHPTSICGHAAAVAMERLRGAYPMQSMRKQHILDVMGARMGSRAGGWSNLACAAL